MAFYSTVLGWAFTVDGDTGDTSPMVADGSGDLNGALNLAASIRWGTEERPVSNAPGETGSLLYSRVDRDLDEAPVAAASPGGEVRVGANRTPEGVAYTIITDTEGNRIGRMADPP